MGRACSTNGGKRNAFIILVGKPDVDGWTILIGILERSDGMVWIGLIWLRIGTRGGLLGTR
jgi:hypothetical protein